ncbi:MAG: carbohydrate porin [Akkermansia sp.]
MSIVSRIGIKSLYITATISVMMGMSLLSKAGEIKREIFLHTQYGQVIEGSESVGKGNLLDELDIIGADYGDETAPMKDDWLTKGLIQLHKIAEEKARLHFFLEQAYKHSWIRHPAPETGVNHDWYKIHSHIGLNLIPSDTNQGTWLKIEFAGASPLTRKTRQTGSLDNAYGASGPMDCDVFEKDFYYLPEAIISQGFARNKVVGMIGVINQSNYFDANAYANTTYGQFSSAPFVNNQALPLAESNFGFILQGQFTKSMYAQFGASLMDCAPRCNPFLKTDGKAFNVILELGWVKEDMCGMGEGAYRIQPFLFRNEGSTNGGMALNMEQTLWKSPFAMYSRLGWSSANSGNLGGACSQISGGLIFKKPIEVLTGVAESDLNFLGLGIALIKPDGEVLSEGQSTSSREVVIECVYTYSLSAYCLIQPSIQFVRNPAGRNDRNSTTVYSVQTVLLF